MMSKFSTKCVLILSLGCLFAISAVGKLAAQEVGLADKQATLALRYQRLEELLLRLSEMEAAENPERASLLKLAVKQSRDKFILEKLRGASQAISGGEYQKAIDGQENASSDLQGLMKLLMSEDRSKRIRDERERIAKVIRDLKRTERAQRSTRARTENGAEMQDVKEEQAALAKRSQALQDELADEEKRDDPTSDQKPGDQKPGDQKPGDQKPGDQKPGDQKPGDQKPGDQKPGDQKPGDQKPGDQKPGDQKPGDQKPGDQKPGDQKPGDQKPGDQKPGDQKPGDQKPGDQKPGDQKPGDQKPGDQKPGDQKPGDQKPGDQKPGDQKPGDQKPENAQEQAESELEQAIEKMKQAEAELEESDREQATEKQREAESKLRAAIDRLERILRQLREEEMARELAKLEARLKKMAAMQSRILDDCIQLAETPKSQRSRQTDLKAGNLAFEEKKVTLEADRAMLLLREEGSSVAFPEVVAQIRADSVKVAQRLGEAKIDAVTQGIQQDILAALEEMIAALQQAQRDLEKKKQQQQQGEPSQQRQQEQPLVQKLAELKLIRTMETRIKSTTERYAGLLESGDADSSEVVPLLRNLSERQNRLYRVTRDLVLKRNQ